MVNILNWDNFEEKICNWVHEDPDDIQKIKNRALMIATGPVFIGFTIGLIIFVIIEVSGRL